MFVNFDASFWQDSKLKQVEPRIVANLLALDQDRALAPSDRLALKRKLVKISAVWEFFGHFSAIRDVNKCAARIGLLLSTTRHVEWIRDKDWMIEDDVARNGFLFTDGCGRMSVRFAKRFINANRYGWRYAHQRHHVPSVLQIRMMGCKGIVMLDPSLDNDSRGIEIVLRKSQEKFAWNMETSKGSGKLREHQGMRRHIGWGRLVGICRRGESRPFVYGRMCKQYVLLLSACGIGDETLLQIQQEYFAMLRRCLDDRLAAFQILCGNSKLDEAEELSKLDEELELPEAVLAQLNKYRRIILEPCAPENAEKLAFSIPILKSRNIFGVADISGQLSRDECFVQVTEHSACSHDSYRRVRQSSSRLNVVPLPEGTKILIMKSPTYYPGDVRVLTQKYVAQLDHLVDCVVFPVQNIDRPHPHEIHERSVTLK